MSLDSSCKIKLLTWHKLNKNLLIWIQKYDISNLDYEYYDPSFSEFGQPKILLADET